MAKPEGHMGRSAGAFTKRLKEQKPRESQAGCCYRAYNLPWTSGSCFYAKDLRAVKSSALTWLCSMAKVIPVLHAAWHRVPGASATARAPCLGAQPASG